MDQVGTILELSTNYFDIHIIGDYLFIIDCNAAMSILRYTEFHQKFVEDDVTFLL